MARETRTLSPERVELRHEIAVELRRARGLESQVAFCGRLGPLLGRAPSVAQWSKYEREEVDPPAYLGLAVRKLVGGPRLAFQESVQRLETAIDRMEKIVRDGAAG